MDSNRNKRRADREFRFSVAPKNTVILGVDMATSSIDLTQLSEHELVELNRKIVDRLRFLRDARAQRHMLQLAPGQKVSFSPEPGRKLTGLIVRFNRKSVTLIAEDGVQWRVAPALLTPIEPKDVEIEVEEPNKNKEVAPSPPAPLRMASLTKAFSAPADIPRNAPCPCGSGKKHKRCCLLKTAAGNR